MSAGALSALFVNDVICLVRAPVVVDVTRRLRLPPVPYLIALATAANVGSVATLTGNPENMLIGSFSGISYRTFLARELPVAAIGLAVVFLVIQLRYGRRLPSGIELQGRGAGDRGDVAGGLAYAGPWARVSELRHETHEAGNGG